MHPARHELEMHLSIYFSSAPTRCIDVAQHLLRPRRRGARRWPLQTKETDRGTNLINNASPCTHKHRLSSFGKVWPKEALFKGFRYCYRIHIKTEVDTCFFLSWSKCIAEPRLPPPDWENGTCSSTSMLYWMNVTWAISWRKCNLNKSAYHNSLIYLWKLKLWCIKESSICTY